jgi:anti-sigma factor RsiW
MSGCIGMQAKFSEYLDGHLTGLEMQEMAVHLNSCGGCSREWSALRDAQASLSALGPVPEPHDLLLRIRIAVSHERARSRKAPFQSWSLAWRNTVGPFLLQAAAGFASAVLLLGTVVVMIGIVAKPESAQAGDEPLGMATAPRLLYSIAASNGSQMADLSGPVVVEAYVNDSGQVYDYSIVSGPDDRDTRSQVEYLLLESVFEPARFFGQPVRGVVVLNFAGVAVRG